MVAVSSKFDFHHERLSEKDFKRLGRFIHSRIGIKMPEAKMNLVVSRLGKRLRKLNIASYTEYCDYLFSPEGMENELIFFIDEITTNKTDFFREPSHFEYLVQKAVPELLHSHGPSNGRTIKVWSAACSRGNEPYTVAMVLNQFAERFSGGSFDFMVLGTDISAGVLEVARKGIYSQEEISPVPEELRKKYLLKNKDTSKKLVRIAPELRTKVKFQQLNLVEKSYRFRTPMDIIFCRNVIIYFDKATQDELIVRLCRFLRPHGYLFMGHSEVLHSQHFPLISVAPAVYKKVG